MINWLSFWQNITRTLENLGDWGALLFLRLILAWEFYEAGITKLNGENWFDNIQQNFPFPFNSISTDVSWFLATWVEILGGIGLALGLLTRFWSLSLMVLTVIAILGVHWPEQWQGLDELFKGYAISDKGFGNYKLPLIFLVMLIPLLLKGSGKLSADYVFYRLLKLNKSPQ
ncbi:DoxX family protein [Aliikangiella maris]|uniref:DoxX family protein n=2 Tax=Aliikangiella maris TaxID=3162458 RepID=A0ABV3MNX9_9GAMM